MATKVARDYTKDKGNIFQHVSTKFLNSVKKKRLLNSYITGLTFQLFVIILILSNNKLNNYFQNNSKHFSWNLWQWMIRQKSRPLNIDSSLPR